MVSVGQVLLVLDDRDVRQIVSMISQAEAAVTAVGRVQESNQLVPAFKVNHLANCDDYKHLQFLPLMK